jgi:hypothetical protein
MFAWELPLPMPTATSVPLESLGQRIARQQSELETLRQEYDLRQARLTELKRRKEELEGQLRQLDAEIQTVDQGKTPPPHSASPKVPPAKPRAAAEEARSPRPNTLPALLVHLVGRAKGPITIKQLADKVEQQKFPTSSKNVPRLVGARVQGLMAKGIFQRAKGQPGVVLARPGGETQTSAAIPVSGKGGSNKGTVSSKTPSRKKAARRPERPLREILTDLLSKSRRPLAARELAAQARAQGYRTKSKKFVDVLWVMLGKMDNVENVQGQGYRLKKR